MVRDKHGIIVQGSDVDPSYQDGGDSAFSTGIMAMCGSIQDVRLMGSFIKSGEIVRHPYQSVSTGADPHNDPRSVSRDQVVAFFSGLPQLSINSHRDYWFVKRSCLNYAKGWMVNKDILTPDVKWYLYKCAGEKAPLLLLVMAYPFAFAHLLWACFISPKSEMNQSVCKFSILGQTWIRLLYKWHPDLTANIREYFSGWRGRSEIAEKLIVYVATKI